MRKLFQEIHEQPKHIRAVFMWVSFIITIAIVLTFTLPSVVRDSVALVNPNSEIIRNSQLVNNEGSIFSKLWNETTANIGAIWSATFGAEDEDKNTATVTSKPDNAPAHIAPAPAN